MADESKSQVAASGKAPEEARGQSLAFDRRVNDDHEAYFNAQFDAEPVYVEPGDVAYGRRKNEMLVATAGSGVLLSIYDQELKMGALGYVLLPQAVLSCFPFLEQADPVLVFKAFEPLEACIGEMKRRGAGKTRIQIRLYGGIICPDGLNDDGLKNTVFVKEFLFRRGLEVFNADTGGPFVRRVHFFPMTGRVVRLFLRREDDFEMVAKKEDGYNKIITSDV